MNYFVIQLNLPCKIVANFNGFMYDQKIDKGGTYEWKERSLNRR